MKTNSSGKRRPKCEASALQTRRIRLYVWWWESRSDEATAIQGGAEVSFEDLTLWLSHKSIHDSTQSTVKTSVACSAWKQKVPLRQVFMRNRSVVDWVYLKCAISTWN